MRRAAQVIFRAVGAGCIAAGMLLTSPVAAQTPEPTSTRISLGSGGELARQLLIAGQPDGARQIAEALLQADPNDSQAAVILAQAQLRLGNQPEARQAARHAWRTADTQRQKFIAAMTMADILAAEESYTRSQFWVRRAIQTAPGPQSEMVAVEAFRLVRQENPLAIELNFGATPSSNVNSGNSNRTINFAFLPGVLGELQFEVPPNERPLSGLELSLQTDLRYRIARTDRSRTSLEFGLYGRGYIMSESARASAPDVTGESLSFAQASVGLLHQWVPEGGENPFSASLTYSHAWYGGEAYRYEIDATLGTQFTLSDAQSLSLAGSMRYSHTLASQSDVMTYSLRGRWSYALDNDDILGVTGQFAKATSDVDDLAYDAVTLGLNYDFGDILPGIDLAASWTEQYRVYEGSRFDPAGREDRISTLGLNLGLQDIEFYGFEPVVSLQGRTTDSSVARFDTEGAQIGINLRSSF